MLSKRVAFLLLALLPVSCSRGIPAGDFIRCAIESDTFGVEESDVTLERVGIENLDAFNSAVYGDWVVSMTGMSDDLFAVGSMSSDSLLGTFCPAGRSTSEPLKALPISRLFSKGGDVCAYVCSYPDSKLLEWNVSESLRHRATIYNWAVGLGGERKYLSAIMAAPYGDDKILVCATGQKPGLEWEVGLPSLIVYGRTDGRKLDVIDDMFSVPRRIRSSKDEMPPTVFLAGVSCASADGSHVAYAPYYLPYIVVSDVAKGTSVAYCMESGVRFDPGDARFYFASVCADNTNIYALYFDGTSDPLAVSKSLCVFGFDGKLKNVVRLSAGVQNLMADTDNGLLYMYNSNDHSLWKCRLSDLNGR